MTAARVGHPARDTETGSADSAAWVILAEKHSTEKLHSIGEQR
jgi:hypothetical protein